MGRRMNCYSRKTVPLVLISLLLAIQTSSASKISSRTKKLKGDSTMKSSVKRKLKRKKKSNPHPRHSFEDANSCLNYSCDELVLLWKFPGEMPDCPGLNCLGSDGTSSGGGGSGGSSSGEGGSGGSSSGGGGSGGSSSGGGGSGGSSSGGGGNGDDDSSGGGGGGGNGDDDALGGGGGGNGDDDDDASGGGGGSDDNNNGGNQSNNNDNFYGNDDNNSGGFNLGDCSSYSDYWMWDLNLSCQESNTTDYDNCECTSAAMMLEDGDLQCPDGSDDIPYCPSGCSICDTCLTLLGCAETRPNPPIRGTYIWNMMWYALAGAIGIVLGIIAMSVHKRNSQKLLRQPLVAEAGNPETDNNVWLAPVS